MKILYEDNNMLVVEKPVGVESQSSRKFEPDMVSEIRRYLHNLYPKKSEFYIGVIHRLDKPVGGIMVYAKNKKTAGALSGQIHEQKIQKKYLAVVCGKPVDNHGVYVDYLLKNQGKNISEVVDKSTLNAKQANLSFTVLETITVAQNELSLLEIALQTGRHHQIRVQLASHGLPLWGDQKYNQQHHGAHESVALYAYQLQFQDPDTKKQLMFTLCPSSKIFESFDFVKTFSEQCN